MPVRCTFLELCCYSEVFLGSVFSYVSAFTFRRLSAAAVLQSRFIFMFYFSQIKDSSGTMYVFAIGLFLVAFQVSCDGAPERLIPVPTPPANVSQEKHLENRAGK